MDESDALITPAEKAELKTTEPYVEGLKVLNKADQGKVLSFQEYVDARDLLITIFSIDNATRPGPLNNATLKDYETAEQGNRIMLVAGHKQSREGPAILGMTPELQRLMEIYVQKIRPQFAPPSETHLLLTKEEFLTGFILFLILNCRLYICFSNFYFSVIIVCTTPPAMLIFLSC